MAALTYKSGVVARAVDLGIDKVTLHALLVAARQGRAHRQDHPLIDERTYVTDLDGWSLSYSESPDRSHRVLAILPTERMTAMFG